jgi:geranylgeranyl pyrophosphate synthase
MALKMDVRWTRGQLRDYTDRLITERYQGSAFEKYLRGLLAIPGGPLTGTDSSGLMDAVLYTYAAFCPERDWRDAMPGAVSVELAHTAWELMDKILDDERPDGVDDWDASQVMNAAMALNSLTVFPAHSLATRGFSPARVARCVDGVSLMCATVAATNHLDLVAESVADPTLDLALEVTIGKSEPIGYVIGHVGAGLATDDAAVISRMTEFGGAVGIYHAICNDLSDVLPGDMRKSDVRRRKKTLPIVYLMTQTPDDRFKEEKRLLRANTPMRPEEEVSIRQALVDSGAIDYTSVVAESYRLQALRIASSLQDRADLTDLLQALGISDL